MELTENGRKLKGATVTSKGVAPEDYMDEHRIHIKGLAEPHILHTYYGKKNAALEEKTVSHLKFKDGAGNDVRNQVALEILEMLHFHFPVNSNA